MKALLFLVISCAAALTARAQAIDFTPRFSEAVEDGVAVRHMAFSDGAHAILYRPHQGWIRSGDAQAAMPIAIIASAITSASCRWREARNS